MTEREEGEVWNAEGLAELSRLGISVVTIDGSAVGDRGTLFDEFAQKLRFPEYFGENWDAFEDCLRDLGWIECSGLLILFRNSGRFRTSCPEEWAVAADILLETIDYWRERDFPFAVLFA